MKYLVTGAAGFIGSNLMHRLQREGHQSVGIDNFGPGSDARNCDGLNILNLDLTTERKGLQDVIENLKPDYIVHLAAESHVDRGIEGDATFWMTQVVGTRNLLATVVATNHKPLKIINQITDEVYGEIEETMPPATEGDIFLPNPTYANSKAAQYFVGRAYVKTHGLPVVSTFPVNNFGPRQNEEKLIPKFIKKALREERLPLMSSHGNQRDWLAVDDMCDALILLCEKGEPGEDYNVGADNHRSNLTLTKEILKCLNKSEDLIEIVTDRKTHDSRYAVDSTKIKELGWAAKSNFEVALKETIEWYRGQDAL